MHLIALVLFSLTSAAAPCEPPADGKPHANRLQWTTASEQDSFAFEVFRSDSEAGEPVKISTNPILAAGTTDETHKYEYRDASIDPQRVYWYSVDLIHVDNSRERIVKAWKADAKCSGTS
jgi:hypothetical protein